MITHAWLVAIALLLAGCSSQPPAPDWQVSARGALDRYTQAALKGDSRVEAAEFARARGELLRTGQPGIVASAELTRCALQVASLVFEACSGFDALRADSPPAARAYADYLSGRLQPRDIELLPVQHRAVARGTADAAALQAMADPLSRLVAAGVIFRSGRASPQVLALATEAASAQGWRRPLLAWLGAQALRAERAGATEEAQRLRRRIALVQGQ